MRKASYFITFFAVIFTLILNLCSIFYPDWFYSHTLNVFGTDVIVRYGLLERCEKQVIIFPAPGDGGKIDYTQFNCRPFPSRQAERCESDNRSFCTLWWTAGYSAELSIVFGAAAALGLVLGMSTGSRRRRVWRAVAVLVALHACFQIVTFGIITDIYRFSKYSLFEYARPSSAYVLNAVSWIADVFIVIGLITTGLAADAGHKWAAGNRNREYSPIEG